MATTVCNAACGKLSRGQSLKGRDSWDRGDSKLYRSELPDSTLAEELLVWLSESYGLGTRICQCSRSLKFGQLSKVQGTATCFARPTVSALASTSVTSPGRLRVLRFLLKLWLACRRDSLEARRRGCRHHREPERRLEVAKSPASRETPAPMFGPLPHAGDTIPHRQGRGLLRALRALHVLAACHQWHFQVHSLKDAGSRPGRVPFPTGCTRAEMFMSAWCDWLSCILRWTEQPLQETLDQ